MVVSKSGILVFILLYIVCYGIIIAQDRTRKITLLKSKTMKRKADIYNKWIGLEVVTGIKYNTEYRIYIVGKRRDFGIVMAKNNDGMLSSSETDYDVDMEKECIVGKDGTFVDGFEIEQCFIVSSNKREMEKKNSQIKNVIGFENQKVDIPSFLNEIDEIDKLSENVNIESIENTLLNDRRNIQQLVSLIEKEKNELTDNLNSSVNEIVAKSQINQLDALAKSSTSALVLNFELLMKNQKRKLEAIQQQVVELQKKYDDCLANQRNIKNINNFAKQTKICTAEDLAVLPSLYAIVLRLQQIATVIKKSVPIELLNDKEQNSFNEYLQVESNISQWLALVSNLIKSSGSGNGNGNEGICNAAAFETLKSDGQNYAALHSRIIFTLQNVYEDFSGAVRTYVRIKPPSSLSDNVFAIGKDLKSVVERDNNATGATTSTTDISSYGPYFGVFPPSFDNLSVYFGENQLTDVEKMRRCAEENTGICRSARQINSGYHMVLFANGVSGSGKSLTLFGNDNEPGIAEIIVEDVSSENTKLQTETGFNTPSDSAFGSATVVYPQIECIVELAYDTVSFLNKAGNRGRIIDLYGGNETLQFGTNMPRMKIDSSERQSFLETMAKANLTTINLSGKVRLVPLKTNKGKNGDTSSVLKRLILAIDSYRIKRSRISETPNNPTSSRSHLVIVMSVGNGNLTVIDSAGFEAPIDILQSFWKKPINKQWQLASLLQTPPLLQPYITEKQGTLINAKSSDGKAYIEHVVTLLREGIYINLSLLDLQTFFSNTPNSKLLKFPISKDEDYSPVASLSKSPSPSTDVIGMTALLTTLKNLKVGKTKFVLINNLRTEKRYRDVTAASLLFSQSISSAK